jgi:hypothetical protein
MVKAMARVVAIRPIPTTKGNRTAMQKFIKLNIDYFQLDTMTIGNKLFNCSNTFISCSDRGEAIQRT